MSKSRWVTGRGGGTEAAIVPASRPGRGGERCARPPPRARAPQASARARSRSAHARPEPPGPEPLPCTRAPSHPARPEPHCARAPLAVPDESSSARSEPRTRASVSPLCRARARLRGSHSLCRGAGMRHGRARVWPHAPPQTGQRSDDLPVWGQMQDEIGKGGRTEGEPRRTVPGAVAGRAVEVLRRASPRATR